MKKRIFHISFSIILCWEDCTVYAIPGPQYLVVTFLFSSLLLTWYSVFALLMLWELCMKTLATAVVSFYRCLWTYLNKARGTSYNLVFRRQRWYRTSRATAVITSRDLIKQVYESTQDFCLYSIGAHFTFIFSFEKFTFPKAPGHMLLSWNTSNR